MKLLKKKKCPAHGRTHASKNKCNICMLRRSGSRIIGVHERNTDLTQHKRTSSSVKRAEKTEMRTNRTAKHGFRLPLCFYRR